MTRVAINGFGRIGRNAFKLAFARPDTKVIAINDLTDTKTLAHLLKHDSNYGLYHKDVSFDEKHIIVDGTKIEVTAEKDPAALPWKRLDIDVVIESTGRFVKGEDAALHIKAGAKKVVISAPAKGDDTSVATHVISVNDKQLNIEKVDVFSNASCTTNSITPVAAIIELTIKLESNGIERGRNMHDGRYVLHMYSILIDGQKEAELAIKFIDGSKEYAKVNIFGAAQHKLGAAGVRQLLAIVKKKFPKLKHIYGDRISGARAKSGHAGERARMTIASTPPAFWIGEKIRSPYMVVLTVRTRGKLFRTPIGWNKRTFISGAFRRFLIYKYVGVITPRQLDLEIQNVMALIARQNGTRVDIRKARRAIQRTSLGFMGMGASIKVTAGAVNWDTGKPILRKFYDTRTLGNFPLTKKQCQSWGIIQGTPISTAPIQLKNITTFDAAIAPRDFSVMYRKFSNAFAQKIAQRYNSIVSRYESEALAKADMSRAIDMIVSKGGEAMCLDYLRDRFEEDLTFKRKLHKKEWRVIYRAMISYTRDRLSQLTPIKGVL